MNGADAVIDVNDYMTDLLRQHPNRIYPFKPNHSFNAKMLDVAPNQQAKLQILWEMIGDNTVRTKLHDVILKSPFNRRVKVLTQCLIQHRTLFREFEKDGAFAIVNLRNIDEEKTRFLSSLPKTEMTDDDVNTLFYRVHSLETFAMTEVIDEYNLPVELIIHPDLYTLVANRTVARYLELYGEEHMGFVFTYFARGCTASYDLRSRLEDYRFELVTSMARTAKYIH